MNKLIVCLVAVFFSILSSQAFAAFYCSSRAGHGFINTGDSMQQVQQACGKPTSQNESTQQQQQHSSVQYWIYENIQHQQSTKLGIVSRDSDVIRTAPSTVYEIKNGKVNSITEDSKATSSTESCQGRTISVGDSSDNVIAACGKPETTSVQMQKEPASNNQVSTWTYDRGNYSTPIILQFKDGKLSNVSQ